ncbi:glycosyltransferase family 4 protein [Roseibium sp. M-1]
MPALVFAYPGDIDTPTGGYGYDRRIVAGLRALGWKVDLLSLGEGFPFPSSATLEEAERRLAALPERTLTLVDGLAFGAMAGIAGRLAGHLDLVALVHHPLCKENGLDTEAADLLLASEKSALGQARHVIVTSPATADQVTDLFGVTADRITVILPGTERPEPYDRPGSDCVRLLSVGTVVPRKGYDLLFDALARLREYGWHLDIVGGLDADPACYAALQQQVTRLDLKERLTFHGAVSSDHLPGFYRQADIFVLASRYEGYGMAYTEALAHGLPVIGSGGGAVRQTLPEGAAIYCGTENVDALEAALARLIASKDDRGELARAAQSAAASLPTWQDAAAVFARTLMETRK